MKTVFGITDVTIWRAIDYLEERICRSCRQNQPTHKLCKLTEDVLADLTAVAMGERDHCNMDLSDIRKVFIRRLCNNAKRCNHKGCVNAMPILAWVEDFIAEQQRLEAA